MVNTKGQQQKNIKNKRLTKEQMRKLLLSAKKKAVKLQKEQGSFSLEVVCTEKDIFQY